jgi:hypothetical protein
MARNTGTVTNTYDNLFTGAVGEPVTIQVASGLTINRGDLLECVVTAGAPAASFTKPTAAAVTTNVYAIAADTITTTAISKIPAYIEGDFNANKVALGGASTVAANYNTLLAQGIVLKTPQSK